MSGTPVIAVAAGKDSISLRPVEACDIAAITQIYAHAVLTGTASFEIEPPDEHEMAARIARVGARGLPWLVAHDEGGSILGYAYAAPFKERAAYAATVENSVYVAPDQKGRGLGLLLLTSLMTECQTRGIRQVLAVIGDSGNAASIGLHTRCGFRPVGTFEKVGFKFGRDLDVVLMQASLSPAADNFDA